MKRLVVACLLAMLAGSVALAPARSAEAFIRISGNDRIATAIAVSERFWPAGTVTVLLARSDDFPDALAGSPLADLTGAPILLTPSDRLDVRVLAEIERLDPQYVFLLGGPAALSPAVATALPSDVTSYRFNGSDRYETAALIDRGMNRPETAAVVASGQRFADALMAIDLLPPRILLSRADRFEEFVPGYSYTLVGGTTVLNDSILTQTGGTRLGGIDRYETSALVLDAALGSRSAGPLFLATGRTAPDALAAGGAVGRTNGYLLIVDPQLGPTGEQAQVLTDNAALFTELFVLGGERALPPDVATEVEALITTVAPTPSPGPEPTVTPTTEPTETPSVEPTSGSTDEPDEGTTGESDESGDTSSSDDDGDGKGNPGRGGGRGPVED